MHVCVYPLCVSEMRLSPGLSLWTTPSSAYKPCFAVHSPATVYHTMLCAAVAARLSAPDGLEGLINSTLWQFRSSINHKAWLQQMYLQAVPQHTPAGSAAGAAAAAACQYACSKQQLEAAAAAAVAAWSQQPGAMGRLAAALLRWTAGLFLAEYRN